MLNPIIYSFTVREFKRSALRLVIPTWQFAHSCLPRLIPTPPERAAQRMSRHGHRARNKTRHRSFELDNNKANLLNKKIGQKRRQTEPAVFGLQKKVRHAFIHRISQMHQMNFPNCDFLLGLWCSRRSDDNWRRRGRRPGRLHRHERLHHLSRVVQTSFWPTAEGAVAYSREQRTTNNASVKWRV